MNFTKEIRCLFSDPGAKDKETHSLMFPSLNGSVFFFFWVIVSKIVMEGLSPRSPNARNLSINVNHNIDRLIKIYLLEGDKHIQENPRYPSIPL